MRSQTVGRISKKGEDLVVIIPRKERNSFKVGDSVIIAKVPFLEFKKISGCPERGTD